MRRRRGGEREAVAAGVPGAGAAGGGRAGAPARGAARTPCGCLSAGTKVFFY